jgi:hypothetical protein
MSMVSNRAPSLISPSVKLSWMANRAVTSSPSGPGAVVKVASGFVGPVGVGAAVADGLRDEVEVLVSLRELESSDFVLSSLPYLPIKKSRNTIPAITPMICLPDSVRSFSGGGDGGAGAVGPQLVPSKYRCPPLPSGSGYHPGVDKSLPLRQRVTNDAVAPDCASVRIDFASSNLLYFSRLAGQTNLAYETAYGYWIPGNARQALLAVFVIGPYERAATVLEDIL